MTPYILAHKAIPFGRLSHVIPASNIMLYQNLYLRKHRINGSLRYLAETIADMRACSLRQLHRYCCGFAAER